VVEAQEDVVPPLAHDIVHSAQDSLTYWPIVTSSGHFSGAPARAIGQVITNWYGPSCCSREVVPSPPQQEPEPPWNAPPLPPQLGVAPSSCYHDDLHPNSQPEVHTKSGGVIVGSHLFSAGDPQVAADDPQVIGCFVFHTKLPEFKLLEVSRICAARGSLRWDALLGLKHLGSFASPIFKLY
jgi:hypothetical protein